MKKLIAYTKEKIVTGIVVIVPIAVVGIILTDVVKKLIAATEPITSKMSSDATLLKTIVAIVLVVVVLAIFFFIGGFIYKTYFGRTINNWLEEKVLDRVPFFKTFKDIARHLTGIEKSNHAIVEVDLYGNNNKLIGLLTDTLTDGRCVIYIPLSPIVNIGQVHIVAKENVEILNISFKAATEIITKIGFGAKDFYKEK
ncbi:MAG: hypothetical protein DRJ13_09900 [Bacteroidetes bacterium]|nr:MAG: hypothetical protein DRJ13_09900 [Bacteroidota bacterium]